MSSKTPRTFFYRGDTTSKELRPKLVQLALEATKDHQAEAILIRSGLHNTTTAGGEHVIDPKGWHGTISFKNADQFSKEVHYTLHAYTAGKDDYELVETVLSGEKPDATLKKKGRPVWPREEDLIEYGT